MYIGQQPVVGRYILLDQISGGFNGTTSGFTMSTAGGVQGVKPGLAQNVLLSLGGVIQQPGVDYTISGSGITFTTPPVSGTTFFATVLGDAQSVGTPSDGTVTPASIAAGFDFAFPNVNVTGVITIASGSAAVPSLTITGDADTGLFSPAADTLGFATAGVQRLSIETGEVVVNDESSDVDFRVESNGNANMLFVDGGNDRVGIGKTPATYNLEVNGGTANTVASFESSDATARILFKDDSGEAMVGATGDELTFYTTTSATERMRIDSSGRLLVGTSASTQYPFSSTARASQLQIKGALSGSNHNGSLSVDCTNNGGLLILANSQDVTTSGRNLGLIGFNGFDGSVNRAAASISCEADAATGSSDMPGRLLFKTTADGGNSPTERMRISSDGTVAITDNLTVNGNQYPTAGALSSRRININGAMQVAQRGTVVNAGNEFAGPDRYKFRKNDGAYTISQDSDVPSGQGFGSSWKADVTSVPSGGDNSYLFLNHRMEGQDLQHLKKGTSSSESLILSFWIKSSVTGTYIVEIYDLDNDRQISKSYSVSSADTWEHKTLTYAGDTSGTLNNDNGASLEVNFWFYAGSNFSSGTLNTSWAASTDANRVVGQVNAANNTSNNIYLTGVQLEVGEKATPFEHRSYGDELARCQRYFRRFCEGANYAAAPGSGTGTSSTNAFHNVVLSPEMRTVPTLDAFSNLRNDDITGGTAVTALVVSSSLSSTEAVFLQATSASSLTQFRPYHLLAHNTSSAKLDLSAEL